MTNILSSDVLETQFGPTEVEVLWQAGQTRIICTKAVGTGQVLEISLVRFVPAGVERFHGVHRAVLAGQSMGKAFREQGLEIQRKIKAAYGYALPASFEPWFGESGPATVVNVSVLAGPDAMPYADILETFSPAVNWPEHKGKPSAAEIRQIRRLDEFLNTRQASN